MSDSFTVRSKTGWFGRIGGAIKGVLIGLLLIVVSVPVLFLNEGRAVKTRKTLDQGAKEVIKVSAETPNPANDGKLIYISGDAKAEGVLEDSEFRVKAEALRLNRDVQYHQWDEETRTETNKKLGGGEENVTVYTYNKKWVDKPVDSSKFQDQKGHENITPQVSGKYWLADPITVGGFTLSSALANQIDNFSEFQIQDDIELPEDIGGQKVHRERSGFYVGEKPEVPEIGDARVIYNIAKPGVVSIVAAQAGSGLGPFTADAGGTIEMLETGSHTAASMFEAAQKSNNMMTWGLRGLGIFLMFFGFNLIFKPLSVLADVVPFFGSIVGAGTGFVAFLLSIVISFFVISVAWIFYRPMIGIPLVLVSIIGLFLLIKKLSANKVQTAAA